MSKLRLVGDEGARHAAPSIILLFIAPAVASVLFTFAPDACSILSFPLFFQPPGTFNLLRCSTRSDYLRCERCEETNQRVGEGRGPEIKFTQALSLSVLM